MLGLDLILNRADQCFLKIDLGIELLGLAQENLQRPLLLLRAFGRRLGQIIFYIPINLLLLALETENIETGIFIWQDTAREKLGLKLKHLVIALA